MGIATMAMATAMARGRTSTVNPASTSWEEMWRAVSSIRSPSFTSPKSSVNNVSVFAISMILILCCWHEWQKWTQAIFYFDLATSHTHVIHNNCITCRWGGLGNLTLLSSGALPQWIPQIMSESKWTRTEMGDFTAYKVKLTTISFGDNIGPIQSNQVLDIMIDIMLLYPLHWIISKYIAPT